jgi:hypothetical protein
MRTLLPKPRKAYQPPQVVTVDLESARYWAKFAAGETRASLWTDVVKKLERAEREGRDVECRWHSVKSRRHPGFPSHGLLEVAPAPAPPKLKFRSRRRPGE